MDEKNLNREEIFARTTIEVKRLGWSNKQGNEYLQVTYGKQKRSELTDLQLQQFLKYLELQSSPNDLND
ncbi:MAG: hypothetical protein KME17_05920 [Cyanosarcina radialis HA8281-LM2]|jgi:hypothetical protein|nr:hypothetical protein [Cyanosarcina radialis HA8281-LM2]